MLNPKIIEPLLLKVHDECKGTFEKDICDAIEVLLAKNGVKYDRECNVLIPYEAKAQKRRNMLVLHTDGYYWCCRADFIINGSILEVKSLPKPILSADDKRQLAEYLQCPWVHTVWIAVFSSITGRLNYFTKVNCGQSYFDGCKKDRDNYTDCLQVNIV